MLLNFMYDIRDDVREASIETRVVMRIRRIAKSDCYLRHVSLSLFLSVRPHGTFLLTLDGFS
jgi:hypothetical protein